MTDDAFVRFVQQALADRGHYKGAVDGKAGDGTLAALTAALGPAPVPVIEPTAPAPDGGHTWDARSAKSLKGVHPDLVGVITRARALTPVPFIVIEGLRTVERQRQLVAQGASRTMRSRHLTGHAVDIVPLRPDGSVAFDWPLYDKVLPAVRKAAAERGVKITLGADWPKFRDGPHVELTWAAYP